MDRRTVAVDVAKTVFEIAMANERGQIVDRKRLGRPQFMRFLTTQPLSRVVMEACGAACVLDAPGCGNGSLIRGAR